MIWMFNQKSSMNELPLSLKLNSPELSENTAIETNLNDTNIVSAPCGIATDHNLYRNRFCERTLLIVT